MADIKSVIGLLSKIVNSYFNADLKAEHFRLAKYDKDTDDVVEVFWNLLYLCSKKSDSTNIVQCVKYHFASLLYRNAEFYALPDDMSYGSRELLLAFSWLLCKNQVLENHLKQELSKSDISKEFNLRFLNRSDNNEPLPTLQTIEDYFNYIMRLSGRINDNIKKLNEYKTKTLCLTTKIHRETFNSRKVSHLSTIETHLIKNHSELKTYLNKIENVSNMLDIYFRWKSKESFYWDWMVTVLKQKEKNANGNINIEIISKFHADLRYHVKDELVNNNQTEDVEIVDIDFPRCIFAPDASESPQINNVKHFEQLKSDNETNSTQVLNFLKTFSSIPN